jgi:hypothetical protein
MFEPVDRPGQGIQFLSAGFRYFIQLLFSYPAGFLASMPLTALLVSLGFSDRGPSVQFAGYEALACLFISPVVGCAAGRFRPSLAPTGRWIWILPVGLTLLDAVSELWHPSVYHLPSFLFASSEIGLGVYFFTLPACCAAGYSVGMALLTLDRRWPTSVRRNVTLSVAGAIIFGMLTAMLHNFERTSIERWAKIRFVESEALQVSPDPRILCQEYISSRDLDLLPRHLAVEKLDRRACREGEVVPADTPPPRERDHYSLVGIEKIRVLEGHDKGLEGWVLVSGLSNAP